MFGAADVIVVGSGAGGAAAAYKLVKRGLRVLMLERGGYLPRDTETLASMNAFLASEFRNVEPWVDPAGHLLVPTDFYNVGGKTKWYGAALLRPGRHEFAPDPGHMCLPWPIGYDELARYFSEAERLLEVNRFDNEVSLQRLIDRICRQEPTWHSEALPLSLRPEILGDEDVAKRFDGYVSAADHKGDAETRLLDAVAVAPNFRLLIKKQVTMLLHREGQPRIIEGVVCRDGTHYRANRIVLAAGALTSPRILQDHIAVTGLAHTLPNANAVGANLKLHLNTAVVALAPRPHHNLLCKTAILLSDAHLHSMVQCLGRLDGERVANYLPLALPRFVPTAMAARAYSFFVMTEDGSSPTNRVASGGPGRPMLDYDVARLGPAMAEHNSIVASFRRRLLHAGLIAVTKRMSLAGTAHALGTMVMGNDPQFSVVDSFGKVHGMEGLYVADASVLPRSCRVNPALTIYAWGLRLGEFL